AYLPHERTRAAQLLTRTGDALERHAARRGVLVSVTHLVRHGGADPVPRVLTTLVSGLKRLGVTSLLTLEAPGLEAADEIAGLPLVADNLVLLRYAADAGALEPTLTVVKTRGSAHDRRRHELRFEAGGLRVGEPRGAIPRAGDAE